MDSLRIERIWVVFFVGENVQERLGVMSGFKHWKGKDEWK